MAQPTVSRYKRAAVAVKTEATYATDPTLDSTNIIEVRNCTWRPNQQLSRDDRFSGLIINLPDIVGIRWGIMTFECLLKGVRTPGGSEVYASGVKPEVDPILRALGLAAAGSFTGGSEKWDYTPQFGATMGESVAAALYAENAPQGKILGAFGSGRIIQRLGEPAALAVTLVGRYVTPGDVALITGVPSAVIPPVFRSAAVTRNNAGGAQLHRVAEVMLDIANEVTLRQSANDDQGIEGALLVDHRYGGSMDPEAVPVATYDWNGERDSAAQRAWSWQIGTTQYNRVKLLGSKMQVLDAQEGQRQGIRTVNVGFKLNATSGGDEFTLRFD